jgi:hypothetical protein
MPSPSSPYSLFLILVLLLSSGCSKEAVTDPKGLAGATTGCFGASYSKAQNFHPTDLEQANLRFDQELYKCMAWNVLGNSSSKEEKLRMSDQLRKECPFIGLESTDKKKMIWCLMRGAAPFVNENKDRLGSNG